MCAIPIMLISRLWRKRAAQQQVKMTAPIFRSDDSESGIYDYIPLGPDTLLEQL